jgi:phosphoribosylformylglycinamidine synthase subunit PurSL
MKNDFRGKNKKGEPITISILPTLLVTAMGRGEVHSLVTTHFKAVGDKVALIGPKNCSLESSELAEIYELQDRTEARFEIPDLQKVHLNYQRYHQLTLSQKIQSGHDLSDGGLLVALSESLIGSDQSFGLDIELAQTDWNSLFGEGIGRFIVSYKPEHEQSFIDAFGDDSFHVLGEVTNSGKLSLNCKMTWSRPALFDAFCGRSW